MAKVSFKHVETEKDQLKEELILEKGALEATRWEILDFEAQRQEVAWAVVEAYKMSKECHQEKLNFTRSTFAEGMDDTQRRVLKCYSDLNLNFLDEDESDDEAPVKVC